LQSKTKQKGATVSSEKQWTQRFNMEESKYKAELFSSEGGQTLAEVSRKLGASILGDLQSLTGQALSILI